MCECVCNKKLYDSASLAVMWRSATNSVIHSFLKSKNKKINSGKKQQLKKLMTNICKICCNCSTDD